MKNSRQVKPYVRRSEAVVSKILYRIMAGESVRSICKDANMPDVSSFYDWLMADRELQSRYLRAKEMLMERLSEEILELSDDISGDIDPASAAIRIHRAKLQIDTRKWLMVHLTPKRYGDKLSIDSSTPELRKIEVEIVKREL